MKKTFFSHDKNFYAALFPLLIIISLQNLISYSVNMADNIMLGAYSQNALSGAALVNQVFFLIQQAAVVIGDGLVVIASQYWGQNRIEPIQQITGMVLKIALGLGIFLIILCSLFPETILGFFTSDTTILAEAGSYLQIYFSFISCNTGASLGTSKCRDSADCICNIMCVFSSKCKY